MNAIPEIKGDIGSDTELEDERRHWLVCVKFGERRLVPRGQFCTFQKGEVCFFVQVRSGDLPFDKRRRLA